MRDFIPANHYWRVGGDTSRVWSSASFSYVPATDATYDAWAAESDTTTPIATEAELQAVLAGFSLSMSGPVRSYPGPTLVAAATDDGWPKVKQRDRDRITGRSSVPENLGAVSRAATAMGTTPQAWFDAALGVTA